MSVTKQVAKQQEELARLCADTEHPLRKAVDAFEAGDEETLTRVLTDFLSNDDANSKELVQLLLLHLKTVEIRRGFEKLVKETEDYEKGLHADDPCAYLPRREDRMVSMQIGENIYKSKKGRETVKVRYEQDGGYQDAKKAVISKWMTGNYGSRDECAELLTKSMSITVKIKGKNTPIKRDFARDALTGVSNPPPPWKPTRRKPRTKSAR